MQIIREKLYTLPLTVAERDNLRAAAALRGISAAKLVRERLSDLLNNVVSVPGRLPGDSLTNGPKAK